MASGLSVSKIQRTIPEEGLDIHPLPLLLKEGNVLFSDALNTFYLQLYGIGHLVKDHSDSEKRNTLLPHGFSFQLAARDLLYASSHRQDNTYHSLCYTSRGALAGLCDGVRRLEY